MSLTLFHTPASPPSRAALLTLRNLGLDAEIKIINILAGDNKTPEFLKINPLGKIPSLKDGSFVIGESRAIAAYLVNSRAPGNSLYPTEPKARALIDSRLYYDATVVFPRAIDIIVPILREGSKEITQTAKDNIATVLTAIEGFLENSKFIAGNNLTIADLSFLANIATIAHMGFDITKYKKLDAWYKSLASIPGYEENESGAISLWNALKSLIEA